MGSSEVPLSRFYWGTYYFPQVVRDILDKSVKKDVYLIGLVEVPSIVWIWCL